MVILCFQPLVTTFASRVLHLLVQSRLCKHRAALGVHQLNASRRQTSARATKGRRVLRRLCLAFRKLAGPLTQAYNHHPLRNLHSHPFVLSSAVAAARAPGFLWTASQRASTPPATTQCCTTLISDQTRLQSGAPRRLSTPCGLPRSLPCRRNPPSQQPSFPRCCRPLARSRHFGRGPSAPHHQFSEQRALVVIRSLSNNHVVPLLFPRPFP